MRLKISDRRGHYIELATFVPLYTGPRARPPPVSRRIMAAHAFVASADIPRSLPRRTMRHRCSPPLAMTMADGMQHAVRVLQPQ
jgi:hypothetical protein